MSLSVVVPVYNSEATLPQLCDRLEAVLRNITPTFEVICVNDGSRDGSWKALDSLAAKRPWLVPIDLLRNFGQHNALLCGIRKARHDVIVTIDDDLQNPPEEIPLLLNKLKDGWDVVYGTPEVLRHGFFRDNASRLTKWMLGKSMGSDIAQHVSAFRAFRTQLRDAFAAFAGPHPSIDVLLTWGTERLSWVRVRHESRQVGASNYSFRTLLIHAINLTLGLSTWPLRVTVALGLGLTVFGTLILIYVLTRYFTAGSRVPGFPFLASITSIFSGAQLLSIGILGEFIARIYLRAIDKPAYAVRTGRPS